MGWSALCAAHCIALWGGSALSVLGGAARGDAHGHEHHEHHGHEHHGHGHEGLGELLELGLVVGAALIAVFALWRGVRLHGDKRPLGLLFVGLAALGAGRALHDQAGLEVALSCVGAVSLIGAHGWSLALAKRRGVECC